MLRLPHPFAGEVEPEKISYPELPDMEWFEYMFDCDNENALNNVKDRVKTKHRVY